MKLYPCFRSIGFAVGAFAWLYLAGPAAAQSAFGSGSGELVVTMDAGVALVKSSVRDTFGGINPDTGECSATSPRNLMDCAKGKLEADWERDYGEPIGNAKSILAVGTKRLRFQKRSAEHIFRGLNHAQMWAAQYARAAIDFQIRTTFSATSKIGVSYAEDDKFANALASLEQRRMLLRSEISDLANQIDPIEAAAMESELRYLSQSPSFNDRALRFVDALITRIDPSYDPATFAEQAAATQNARQAAYIQKAEELKAQLASLENESATLERQINAATSNTSSQSVAGGRATKGSLFGVTIIDTAEFVNMEEGYLEVSVLSVWSPQLQLIGAAMLTGTPVKVLDQSAPKIIPKSAIARNSREYIDSLPLAGLSGSHLVIDEAGAYRIIGAAMVPLPGGNNSDEIARESADFLARRHIQCALYSQVVDARNINDNLDVIDDDFQTVLDGEISSELVCGDPAGDAKVVTAGVRVVKDVDGRLPHYGNLPVQLVALELSMASAETARNIAARNKIAHAEAIRVMRYWEGYQRGLDAEFERSSSSRTDEAQGMRDAMQDFQSLTKGSDSGSGTQPSVKSSGFGSSGGDSGGSGAVQTYSGSRGSTP